MKRLIAGSRGPFVLIAVVLALLLLVVATRSDGSVKKTAAPAVAQKKDPRIRTYALLIAKTQVAVWTCQDQRRVPRTPASVSPWALPQSLPYRKWALRLWTERKVECLKELHAHDDVIRRLQRGLAGTPMDGSAGPLEAISRKWGISPYFIAGIAGTESSFGAASCSGNPYNAYGLSSCGSGWSVPYFNSWAESYEFMGRFLTSRWPSARTTYDYHGYAANSDSWGHKCAFWMRVKFGVDNLVAYPN